MATKYFLISASRDHVLKGIEGGFKHNPVMASATTSANSPKEIGSFIILPKKH